MTALKILPAGLAAWLAGAAAAWAQQAPGYGGEYGYGHHMWGGGWGGMIFGPLFGLLFIAAIAVAVLLVVRALGGGRGGGAAPGAKSALDILDERFARGEIDAEEYAARKKVLTGE